MVNSTSRVSVEYKRIDNRKSNVVTFKASMDLIQKLYEVSEHYGFSVSEIIRFGTMIILECPDIFVKAKIMAISQAMNLSEVIEKYLKQKLCGMIL